MAFTRWRAAGPLPCILAALLLVLPAMAQSLLSKTFTTATLSLNADVARPGETVLAAIHLKSTDGWHTYWRNSGDDGAGGPVGQPTRIDWTLPAGVTAGAIQWPVPHKYVEKEFHTHILEEGTLIVPLSIAATLAPGPLSLSARVRWLECKEECVPGQAILTAAVTVGAETKPSAAAAAIQAAHARIPSPASTVARAYWEGAAGAGPRGLVIEWENAAATAGFDFFPYEKQSFVSAKTTALPSEGGTARLRKTVTKEDSGWATTVRGVLAVTKGDAAQASEVTLTITDAPAGAAPVPGPAAAAAQEPVSLGKIALMLGFAFIGGLILNIMPCVLPVLALKILGFVNQAKKDPGYVRQLGMIYGLGVIFSFLGLATVALLVQKAGGVAGWSTAFQSPLFRTGLTILITLVALNLFGLFEVTLHPTATETAFIYASKEGPVGAFFNGVLAAALATPCTAPFLGAAIGFAFTQPPAVLLLFFVTAGLGLALPFVILCWKPSWLKLLPRPGHWMERFKVAMGFPMLATALWLFWFTATRMGEAGVLYFGLMLVTLAAAAWVWGEFVQRGTTRRAWGGSVSVALILFGFFVLLPKASERSKIQWQKWSPEAVAKAVAEGRPVLVDFTADSCLNCKFNKKTSIEIESTIQQLGRINAVVFEGDFTDADPVIAQELQRYGRRGVPLVLVYSKKAGIDPKVLPTVLTPSIVHEALDWAVKN